MRFLPLIAIFIILSVGELVAVGTRFKLQILPIDCLFEIINHGTGEIVYLTPEECGVYIEPPFPTPPHPGVEDSPSPRFGPFDPERFPLHLSDVPGSTQPPPQSPDPPVYDKPPVDPPSEGDVPSEGAYVVPVVNVLASAAILAVGYLAIWLWRRRN